MWKFRAWDPVRALSRWPGGPASAGSRPGCPPAGAVGGLAQYRRHQPGFGPACLGVVVCLCVLIDLHAGMLSWVAKRVTQPVRNREARVTGPHLA